MFTFRHPQNHPQHWIEVEGVQVPLLIAGDPAYPLLPWLMKGFSGPSLSAEEAAFNLHLSGSHVKVEHTFGLLKSRWRVLAKRSDIDYRSMPTVVVACCILHNLCEREKQRPHRVLEEQPLEPLAQPPPHQCNSVPSNEALAIRDALVRHLSRVHGNTP